MGVRAAGLLAGLCLVGAVALQAWRVPASPRAAGLEVDLRAVPSGEVGVAPAGAVIRARALTPGGPPARGRVRLSNRTAEELGARPRVTGGDPALDRLVEVELVAAGRVVFRGPVGRLRGDLAALVPLRRGGTADVAVRASVPRGAGRDAVARAGRWTLTFSGAGAPR
jgi:hypothetical protein